jgi:hypothetical protein
MMTSVSTTNSLASLSFPRTGKRGVPQQFPRRLYEMLDGETKLLAASADHPKVISWSESGKAFRIYDVTEFAASVLPKYFRTKKFSSFQRNLNLVSHLSLSNQSHHHWWQNPNLRSLSCVKILPNILSHTFDALFSFIHQYGFTKVRRGPETDMYAHESFICDHPELLLDLRKTSAAPCQRLLTKQIKHSNRPGSRAVSPSPSNSVNSQEAASPIPKTTTLATAQQMPQWAHVHTVPPAVQVEPRLRARSGTAGWGKLDLLAFALAHESFSETN